MKTVFLSLLFVAIVFFPGIGGLCAQSPGPSPSANASPVPAGAPTQSPVASPSPAGPWMRPPFTLKLLLDSKGKVYEEKIDNAAYVDGGSVFLYNGDNFGVKFVLADGKIQRLIYEPIPTRADVSFHFYQEEQEGRKVTMLMIKNNTSQNIVLDGALTLPGNVIARKTTILPIGSGSPDYEAWAFPVVRMEINNIHFQK